MDTSISNYVQHIYSYPAHAFVTSGIFISCVGLLLHTDTSKHDRNLQSCFQLELQVWFDNVRKLSIGQDFLSGFIYISLPTLFLEMLP